MSSQSEVQTVKVGILFSQTGVTAAVERSQLNATLLAIEEAESDLQNAGLRIEPIIYDPSSQPDRYRHLAERLLSEDRVSIVIGCYMSSARRAVIPVVERWNALLCYPTFYEGFEYSKNVLYGGALPNQTSIVLARHILREYGNRVYSVGSDYIFPHESNRLMRNILLREGGVVVGESYLPLDSPMDLVDSVIDEILERKPSAVFSTIVGGDIPKFYKAYRSRGIQARDMPIASITATEAELGELKDGEAEGHVCAAPYFGSVDTPESKSFSARYYDRFPAGPALNMCAEAAYYSTILVCDALRSGKEVYPQSILQRVHGREMTAPQGLIKVDPHNNHVYVNCRIGRINRSNRFEVLEEILHPIRPDPYLVEYSGSLDQILGQTTA